MNERRLWTIADVADYVAMSKSHTAQKVVVQPDFPKPVRVLENGHPRWVSTEVMEWAEGRRCG